MRYEFRYENPQRQYIPIKAKFDCRSEKEIILQFPTWRPGRYELADFSQYIKNFTITDDHGKNVEFVKKTKDSWMVNCLGTETIVVSYKFHASILNAGSTFIDDRQLYVNPVNCCIYIPDRQNESCELILEIPADFKIASAIPFIENRAVYKDYHELVDSPFIASGHLQVETYEVLDIKFYIWFMGDFKPEWDRIISDFQRFTYAQIDKFSSRKDKYVGFPVDEYHFIFQILNIKAYHGVEHEKSTIISLGPTEDIMSKLYDELLGVSSHELYHTWNVKNIRPADMLPYDYSQENYSKLGYVAEGVTTYLGDVFLAESGVKDFTWYKKEMEKLLQRHFDNFGRFNYSVAESSWDTWLDGYKKGAPDRKVSIYNEGALLAFILDMKIRKASKNKKSIHSVMNDLYQKFGLKEKGYTEQDYKRIAEDHYGANLDAYFKDYVNGTRPFESLLVEAIDTIGFSLEMEANPKWEERLLGLRLDPLSDKPIVSNTYPGSSADLAGLIYGDEILSVNKLDVNRETISQVLEKEKDHQISLSVNRMGRIIHLICPNTNRDMYPIYKIQKLGITDNLHKRIFKNWIGKNWEDA